MRVTDLTNFLNLPMVNIIPSGEEGGLTFAERLSFIMGNCGEQWHDFKLAIVIPAEDGYVARITVWTTSLVITCLPIAGSINSYDIIANFRNPP